MPTFKVHQDVINNNNVYAQCTANIYLKRKLMIYDNLYVQIKDP